MVKPGDTVRYLNDVGGGKVIRVEGQIAYVDDDGFETPVHIRELVVVLPAGHKPSGPGNKVFDQKAFDVGRTSERSEPEEESAEEPLTLADLRAMQEEEEFPIEETEYGDDMTILLAFEPANIKRLSDTTLTALLVNDSNYFMIYQLLRREGDGWIVAASGEAAPNEIVELGGYTMQSIELLERVVLQAMVYKKDKSFEVKTPLSVSRKIDISRFAKAHHYQCGMYFDTPVLEVPILAEVSRRKKVEATPGNKRNQKNNKNNKKK